MNARFPQQGPRLVLGKKSRGTALDKLAPPLQFCRERQCSRGCRIARFRNRSKACTHRPCLHLPSSSSLALQPVYHLCDPPSFALSSRCPVLSIIASGPCKKMAHVRQGNRPDHAGIQQNACAGPAQIQREPCPFPAESHRVSSEGPASAQQASGGFPTVFWRVSNACTAVSQHAWADARVSQIGCGFRNRLLKMLGSFYGAGHSRVGCFKGNAAEPPTSAPVTLHRRTTGGTLGNGPNLKGATMKKVTARCSALRSCASSASWPCSCCQPASADPLASWQATRRPP